MIKDLIRRLKRWRRPEIESFEVYNDCELLWEGKFVNEQFFETVRFNNNAIVIVRYLGFFDKAIRIVIELDGSDKPCMFLKGYSYYQSYQYQKSDHWRIIKKLKAL